MKKVTVAATQMSASTNAEENIKKAEQLVRKAAAKGANIILLQELFESQYFPQLETFDHYDLAQEEKDHPMLERMCKLAKELKVVLPISFYEKRGIIYYNTVLMIDADGSRLGIYRKTHIPDDPGYYEKFYFSPGDTGFKVFHTKFARVGVGICWDQWFPETARSLVLKGAELIFYPTAIGSVPLYEDIEVDDTADIKHWQNVMLGHAAANMVPVIASNRLGREDAGGTHIDFWGSSFIGGTRGEILQEADTKTDMVITESFDLGEIELFRRECCVFRDRRPECYETLFTLDGVTKL